MPKMWSCGLEVDECFRDKAAENELKTSTIKCTNQDCPWEGLGRFYKEHIAVCKFTRVPCPNKKYGCTKLLSKSRSVEEHLERECQFIPVQCPWCSKEVHNKEHHIRQECTHVVVCCIYGCGEKIPRKDVAKHIRTICTHQLRDCDFKHEGCDFKGNIKDLTKHYKEQLVYHNQLVRRATRDLEQSISIKQSGIDKQIDSLKSEVAHLQSDIAIDLQPLVDSVVRVETTIQQLQEGFGEMALMVQTLQASSYNGTFIWKIPELQGRRGWFMSGKKVPSDYSPFYTDHHGYKMCLKGTHLSFFLALLRAEYNALLTLSFRQAVTLMLLDQNESRLHPQEQARLKLPYGWLQSVLLTSGDIETNPGPSRMSSKRIKKVTNAQLGISAHTAVYEQISSLGERWRKLFTMLGLDDSTLSYIERNYSKDAERCLLESIKHWLQCDYDIEKHEPPSWRSLVAAIGHSAGGQNHALAVNIAKAHKKIQKKATKSKGKGSRRRRSRGLIKLRKGHPYMHSPTSVVVNMHFHGTCIIHQRH